MNRIDSASLSRRSADIVAWIVAAVDAAPIDAEPTENIYLEAALPPPVAAELLQRLPPDQALDPLQHREIVRPDGSSPRLYLDLTAAALERLPDQDRAFWRDMIDAFESPELADALTRKFSRTLTARFRGEPMPDLVAQPFFFRDHPGYRISPHCDAASKILTLQLYLPADEDQRHLGTTFNSREGDGFAEIKTNAFLPNTGYAFVRTDESWHSVREIGEGEAPRNSIALIYFVRDQAFPSPTRMM